MTTDTGVDRVWLERRVLTYAHQGGAKEGPSSTLLAMRQAVVTGATAIELDVHRTRDGVLVVCHDATVDRTTDVEGRIAAMTLAEIQSLDNAYWFVPGKVVDHDETDPAAFVHRGKAPADRDLGILTLDEVLEAFPVTPLNLDIKQTGPDVEPYEEQLARTLRDHGRTGDVIVASFHDAALDAFLAACHRLGTRIGTSCGPGAVVALAQALQEGSPLPAVVTRHVAIQVPPRFGKADVVTAEAVQTCHAAGMAVHVWTIDDEPEMARLLDLGVDGIMTDRPSVCAALIADRGLTWSR